MCICMINQEPFLTSTGKTRTCTWIRTYYDLFDIIVLVCEHYCGKDGVFGTEWKNKCDDDEYYCCGVREER